MGMYDSISVFMKCPICNTDSEIDLQTKDLGKNMYMYKTYVHDSFMDRKKIKVFKKFPLDAEDLVWNNQEDRKIARATVPEGFKDLPFVKVIGTCYSTHSKQGDNGSFRGKIKIEGGLLCGIVYDIYDKTRG